jgi:predicted nucleotidyltransferase
LKQQKWFTMIISEDISSKIEPSVGDVLGLIKEVADQASIPFFLIGAKARDLFFSAIFDIPTKRASLDLDIAIKVKTWEEVAKLVELLLATGQIKQHPKLQFRFTHDNGTLFDIVPFGDIERPTGKVQWPSDDAIMTTIGFEEAFDCSMNVQIKKEPRLEIRICTPPSLVILKLISWNEKYPERAKDAQDVDYIMRLYIEAGNDERLYAADSDISKEEGYDYNLASARLLGRDISKIGGARSLPLVTEILERETAENSEFKLITDMNRGETFSADRFEQTRALVTELLRGIKERGN